MGVISLKLITVHTLLLPCAAGAVVCFQRPGGEHLSEGSRKIRHPDGPESRYHMKEESRCGDEEENASIVACKSDQKPFGCQCGFFFCLFFVLAVRVSPQSNKRH